MKVLRIRLLGEFSLVYGDEPVTTVNTARMQSLLSYLVLHRDAPQARHHLAYQFWPDSAEPQARTNLRKLFHYLHQALPDAERFLCADTHTLQWRPEAPFSLDVAEFESAASMVASPQALRQAVALYRGDLLPSCYEDWILPERERLRQVLVEATERLVALLEDERDYQAAIGYAQRLLQYDPLNEATYRHLMRLHALGGDRATALRAYHACATILQRELGVEPGPTTREAYERLLRVDETTAPLPGPKTPAAFALVGRQAEWARLQAAWHAALHVGPRLVLISGEAGIGKSRLAEELLQWANRQGLATASAYCYAAEGALAYAPVAAWLRARPLPALDSLWLSEVARLLPEILITSPDVPPPGPLSEAWQRGRLFEALARAILGDRTVVAAPLLLLIEDLQWCDPDTLEWLGYLLRFNPQARLLVVGTLRTEEVDAGHPLAALLTDLRRAGQLTEIVLGPLIESETAALAAEVTGQPLEREQAASLYRETEGVPLFVVESLHAGLTTAGLPPQVETVLAARLAQLTPPARELAGVAAVIGHAFRVDVLAQASGVGEEALMRGLDEMWRRRIVREQGTDNYDFSHAKLRDVAYAGLSAAYRRLLHRRVAEALVAIHAHDVDAISAQVATHYEQAGLPEQAVSYYRRAAAAAQRVYANQNAIIYLSRAIELIPAAAHIARYDLLLARETIYALQRAREAQVGDLTALQDLATALDDPLRRAQVAVEQGNYLRDISDFPAAITAAQQALAWIKQARLGADCAVPGDGADLRSAELVRLEIEARYLWGMTLDFAGNYADACIQHELALALARENGLRRDEARCLYGLSRSSNDTSAARACLETSLPIYREVGDQVGESLCLNQLGYCLSVAGDYEAAVAHYEQALRLARQIGFRLCEANVLFRLGELHNQIGDYAGSKPYLEQALSMARQDNDQRSAAQNLYNLSWAERGLGRPEAAREHAQEALAICRAIGDRNGEAAAWKTLGEALVDLSLWVEATVAFQRMMEACRGIADQSGVIDAWARLAQVALAQGDIDQAQDYIEQVLSYHDNLGSFQDTYVDMFPAYLACYQVLQANHDPRADRILETAYTLLQEQAARITAEPLRRTFLENALAHGEIVRAWNNRAPSSLTSLL